MAKSKNNVVTHGLSGRIGDLLVFRQRGGKTIVSKMPQHSAKESDNQKKHRKRFQQAVLYAKVAIVSPENGEQYKTSSAKKGKTAFNVAVADFFNAPDIEQVDMSGYTGHPGDMIHIRVTDDFKVETVFLRISNADGSLVEEGNAVPDPSGYLWTYTAVASNDNLSGDKILVTASDMPGNISMEEQTL